METYRACSTSHSPNGSLQRLLYESLSEWKLTEVALRVIKEHRMDHLPLRSLCDECNEGHGRERRYGKVSDQHRLAIVSIDYAFVTRNGSIVVEGDRGWNDLEALKLLIVKDSLGRAVFAHAVPKKGVDDKRFAVDITVDDVLWPGYEKVILMSDNEPAIIKLLK